MIKQLFIFLLPVLFLGCSKEEQLIDIEPTPVDSFMVKGIDVGQQVQNFHYINDSSLSSYDLIHGDLVFFHKAIGNTYTVASHHEIEAEPWSTHFTGDDGLNYFISRENALVAYSPDGKTFIYQHQIHHTFDYLKDAFMLISSNDGRIIKQHDTLITFYGHSDLKSYQQYFKEPSMAEFLVNADTVRFIRTYLPKPKGLNNYCFPMAKHAFKDNTIYVVYPCYDTIYCFDRSKNKTSKVCMHNKDYKLPSTYDNSKAFTPGYGSYQTQYSLHNFQYTSIFYNERSKHFVLFYYAPVTGKVNGRLPTPADQKLRAIILDTGLNLVGYYHFEKPFVQTDSYFFIPNKGLAMPIFKGLDDYENTLFYIYNL